MLVKSGQFNYDAVGLECPAGFTKITEGTTAVLEPPPKEKSGAATTRDAAATAEEAVDGQPADQAVFYNPAQVVNRDLSISVIELFSRLRLTEPRRRGGTREGITILEALSATGLRAIRYYKEITNVRYIIANDMDADAVDCIVRNCAYNGVPVQYPTLTDNMPASAIDIYAGDVADTSAEPPQQQQQQQQQQQPSSCIGVRAGGAVLPNLDDANDLMFRLAMNSNVHPGQRVCLVNAAAPESAASAHPSPRPVLQQELMDVVDLDPYGSASPFLDGAFRCVKEGGLMLVTSTDSAILCGNFADTAHAKYSSMPYKASHCHEAAVRTLLACIERVANKHKKYIVPLLSLHIDFYVRCFLRVYTQPAEVKLSVCKLGYQLQCSNCPAFWTRPMATARLPRPSKQERRRYKRDAKDNQRQQQQQRGDDVDNGAQAEALDTPTTTMTTTTTTASSPHQPCGKRGRDGDGEDGSGAVTVAYPAAPSRQSSPKLTPLTLQHMPNAAAASTCPVCGSSVVLSGPLYAAPTQHPAFLAQLLALLEEREREGRLNAAARITGLVRTASEELHDCPLFYILPDVASYVRVRCPPTPYVVGALARLGYRCSQVHCAAAGIKVDCPPEVLFGVLLQWKTVQDAADAEATGGEVGGVASPAPDAARPLLVTALSEANFTYDRTHDFRGRVLGVAKFVPNAPSWGPRRRHQGAAAVATTTTTTTTTEAPAMSDKDAGVGESA
ncbi:N(2), N(2)-dimethylguanosine tRNA methyltransferase [Novymonas esmeraldas]|uniref:tRNA (guanine(26)-N(2))-dimethyltransferase n=1 Tax=Novymonas esmeraldas TaxID=1808958 RepID=A0AAW0EM38_9TRYP